MEMGVLVRIYPQTTHHNLADHRSINLVVGGVFAPVDLFMIPSVNPQPKKRTMQKATAFDYG